MLSIVISNEDESLLGEIEAGKTFQASTPKAQRPVNAQAKGPSSK